SAASRPNAPCWRWKLPRDRRATARRSAAARVHPPTDRRDQLRLRLELQQVPGTLDDGEAGPRDGRCELSTARQWDPRILRAPDDGRGDPERRVTRLDLVGVPLVGLRDLAVEGRLADRPEPRCDQQLELVVPDAAVTGAADVLLHQRPVQPARQ